MCTDDVNLCCLIHFANLFTYPSLVELRFAVLQTCLLKDIPDCKAVHTLELSVLVYVIFTH